MPSAARTQLLLLGAHAGGLSATRSFNVKVIPTIALQGATSGIQSETLNFQASLAGANLAGSHTVVWNFGDGTSRTFPVAGSWQTQTHVYATPGNYTVNVQFQQSDGQTVSATLPVTIGFTDVRIDPADPDFQTLVVGGTEENDLIRVVPAGRTGVQVWNRGQFWGAFRRHRSSDCECLRRQRLRAWGVGRQH